MFSLIVLEINILTDFDISMPNSASCDRILKNSFFSEISNFLLYAVRYTLFMFLKLPYYI
jgi:hypothetical protein